MHIQMADKSHETPGRSNHFCTPHSLLSQLTTMPLIKSPESEDRLQKRRQTTKVERVKIIELSAQGYSKKIAVSDATVSRVL